jgi:hypothetical protein
VHHDEHGQRISLWDQIARQITFEMNGCWEWSRPLRDVSAYPKIMYHGKHRQASRVAYELLVGPIPEGMQLDHLCRNRICLNPLHLEPVTPKENVRRGTGPCADHGRQTHCQHGHEFTPANTYYARNGRKRECRACHNLRSIGRRRLAA